MAEDIPGEGALGEKKVSPVKLGCESTHVSYRLEGPVVGTDCRAMNREKIHPKG